MTQTINQRIARLYDRSGDEACLHLHELANNHRQRFGYRDWVREAWSWRNAFAQRGLLPGDRVIIILPHGLEVYASFCGALLGGMVPAFFAFPSPKLSKEEYFKSVTQLITCTGGKLIVTYDALKADLLGQIQGSFGGQIMACSEVESDLFAEVGAFYQAAPQEVAFLQFSSGTTGLKKGVAISHQALLRQVDSYAQAIELNATKDVVVSWLPLYHDMGLITCYLLPLLTGVKLVAMSPFEWVKQPLALLELITEYRGTLCWLPNFAYNLMGQLAASKGCEGLDLSSMRCFINCSEPVLDTSHAQFLSQFESVGLKASSLSTCYAMAENTFAMTQSTVAPGNVLKVDVVDQRCLAEQKQAVPVEVAEGRATGGAGGVGVGNIGVVNVSARDSAVDGAVQVRRNVSCGRAVAGTELFIVDDQVRSLPERQVGQIAIRSPCLFTQYFNNPVATKEAFYGETFLTGDIGYLAEGELYVIGRSKDTLIFNGKNIYPQDIEHLINGVEGAIPGRNAAVGVFNESFGSDQLVLLIESNLTDSVACGELKKQVYEAVSSHFEIQVAEICIVEPKWLKKSTSGKISRNINRQRYLEEIRGQGPGAGAGAGKGEGKGEVNLLAQVRACVLAVVSEHSAYPADSISLSQSLVNSGIIDSLSLASLLASLELKLGVALPAHFAEDINAIDSIERIAEKLSGDFEAFQNAASVSQTERGNQEGRVSQWFSTVSKSLLEEEGERKYALLPQLKVSDHLPTCPHPQLGRVCVAHFKSDSLNTDENGCRVSTEGEQPISLERYRSGKGKKALVIGSSTAFGIGVSRDSKTFSNRLNGLASKSVDGQMNASLSTPSLSCYNGSLRSSLVHQELKAAELYFNDHQIDCMVWFSGLNNLSFPLSTLAQHLAAVVAEEGHSGVAYKKDSWQKIYNENILNPIEETFKQVKDSSVEMIFCLQPVLTWIDKIQTTQEQALMTIFDSCFDLPLRQVISVSFAPIYQRYSEDVARLCNENNMRFIDFNRDSYFASNQWLFADRVHLTDLAHEHIAEVIYPMVAA